MQKAPGLESSPSLFSLAIDSFTSSIYVDIAVCLPDLR